MTLKTPLLFAAFFSAALAAPFAMAQDADARLRIICVSAVAEDQKVILASRDTEGKWNSLATVALRTSLVSDWLPTAAGELHLAVREDKALKSICHFTCPVGSRRTLVALIADPEGKSYTAHAIDPEKAGFGKGSLLILNLGEHAASVTLGDDEHKIEVGQQLVTKPKAEEAGMLRMLVSRTDEKGESTTYYDRQVSCNPISRKIVLLLPDQSVGLRVVSISEFGPFD